MDVLNVFFFILLYRASVDAGQNDKRLVLHSDTDVVQEINNLRTELNNLTTNQILLTSKLQEKDVIIKNLTTVLNEHTSKQHALEQSVAKQHTNAAGKRNTVNTISAPCAVCHTVRGTNIMIPGRTDCYDGWTKEYSGYLVSDYYGYAHGTEYVCLDRRPEVVVGGKSSANEGMLWLVDAQCGGSLECPPYVNGRELACVVCSA